MNETSQFEPTSDSLSIREFQNIGNILINFVDVLIYSSDVIYIFINYIIIITTKQLHKNSIQVRRVISSTSFYHHI